MSHSSPDPAPAGRTLRLAPACQGWRRAVRGNGLAALPPEGRVHRVSPLKCGSGRRPHRPSVSTETPAPVPAKEALMAAEGGIGPRRVRAEETRGTGRKWQLSETAPRGSGCSEGLPSPGRFHFCHQVVRGKGPCSPSGVSRPSSQEPSLKRVEGPQLLLRLDLDRTAESTAALRPRYPVRSADQRQRPPAAPVRVQKLRPRPRP